MPGTSKIEDRLSLDAFLELPGIDERPHLEILGGKMVLRAFSRNSEAEVGMKHSGRGEFQRGGE